MKTKAIYTALALMVITGNIFGQATNECAQQVSLFAAPAKAKNYAEAYKHYSKTITECPTTSLAIYQYAEKMFKDFIKKGDKSKMAELEAMYNMRMKNFPEKSKAGDIMSDLAQVKYDNGIGAKMEQFNAFDTAFKKDEKNFNSPKSIYTYFSLAVDLHDTKQKDVQEVFDMYDVIIAKIETEQNNLAGKLNNYMEKEDSGTLSTKDKKYMNIYERNLEAYGKIKGSVDGKLGKLADCPNLIPMYQRLFEEKKNDINWLKSAAGKLNSKDCETPLFFQMVQQLHNLEPSAKSAFYLGRLADREGNASQAMEYYNQAADLETSPRQKANIYYRIAENFRKKGSYGSARSYYLKQVEAKPSDGVAYLKIANMYAASVNSCGNTPFEKRAVYWKAAEMADRAARVDANIAGTARATANSYRGSAPSKSDIFSNGMQGKTISFRGCWVGGSVRVPNL
ncbi:MAG: tetratricopeptide repeat protein [Marinirhabdus sp.]